jgi:hypothetical protein
MLNHIGSRIKQDDRAEGIERLVNLMIKYGQINSNTIQSTIDVLSCQMRFVKKRKVQTASCISWFLILVLMSQKRRIHEFILIDSYPLQAYPFDCKRREDLGLQI